MSVFLDVCRLCCLQQLCFADWKAPDCSQLCRGTLGSFVENGWCIISIPLAKLLIEEVMSRAAPPWLAEMNAHAAHQLKAACAAPIAVSVCVVRALSRLRLRAVPTLTQGFHQALLAVNLGRCREFWTSRKQPPRRCLRSCQLSQSIWWHRKGTPNLHLITF